MSNANSMDVYQLNEESNKNVTVKDLVVFKFQLLQDIRKMLTGNAEKGEAKKWMKSLEVQKLLDISRGKLLTLRISGKLPFTRIGGVIYYNHDDIIQMLESNKQQL